AILSTPRSLGKAQELAEVYAIAQASSDYESILANPEVDTVYVALPNHLHYDYAKKALLAGKHVICEKPFTLQTRELVELAELAAAHKVLLIEAITNQYLANYQGIKAQLETLGELKVIECNYSQYSS
ncbi:Gfo/Idh/MocA family oxidoreductase, partial [Enterococcus faecalis]|nr:Gfo/Idh/MocA family oxidoreductase [Enterococcus faecalis]